MKRTLALLACMLPLLSSQEAKSTSGTDPRSEPPEATISFAKDVFPVILRSCSVMECHGNAQSPILLTHKRISKYAKRIKARLTDEENPMPPTDFDKKLSKNEVSTILTWIQRGSQNN